MTKVELVNTVTRTAYKIGFKLKKHAPEIMVVSGVIGGVVSGVLACKATTKLNEILDKAKDEIDAIHQIVENQESQPDGETYTEEDTKKALTIVYAQTGVELVKLYAPAVTLGALSITSILAGHNITRQRNVALAAAYATIDRGFKEYRGRVVERFGKELDRELKYNIKAKEIEETVVNEDGTETTVKKTVEVAEVKEHSDYARFYCEGCTNWSKDPEDNLFFLKQQQNWANERLKTQGYLFLNDVYEMLGIQKTKAGQQVGWVYDAKDPYADNYVDFGIYEQVGVEVYDERKRAFVNGYERNILLDFNVDGYILDSI